MNALLLSAFWGVIMMFSSFLLKRKAAVRNLAVIGIVLLVIANILEMKGIILFHVDTRGMMYFDRFARHSDCK